jgi:dihydrodipicolinate synthase/N-acetylneuraminate lyase
MKPVALPAPLRGIIPPLVTPLLDGNTLDVGGLERLVEHVLGGGVHGLFVLGTTGEAPSLDQALQREVVTRVCDQVAGRVPVLVGITDTSFVESIRLAHHAATAGAGAVVLAPPHYFPLDQADLVQYIERVCGELTLPLFLYNMPSHTKIHFAPETLRRLVAQEKIVGLKDSAAGAACFHQVREWIGRERPDFSLLIGPEELLAESIPQGAHGGVCGGANILPRLFVEMYHAAMCGDAAAVAVRQQRVLRLADTIYAVGRRSSGAIIQIKAALSCAGICSAHVAEPLHQLAPGELDLMRRNLAGLDIEHDAGRASVDVAASLAR